MTFYGTAFEEFSDEERDAVKKKPKSFQDEIVTDEKGRRRFHGAFTGGFSAGYFNTAGSKHGWVPQTFKSSRDNRAEKSLFKVDDFMDEEDYGEFGIASKRMRAKSDYQDALLFAGEKGQLAWERSIFTNSSENSTVDSCITSKLIDILKPVNDSIGVRLLKKMGWKAGKGIGPTISRRVLEKQKVIDAFNKGKSYSFDEEAVNEVEKMVPDAEFCFDDIDEFKFALKNNTHGLGYVPLTEKGVLSENFGAIKTGLKLSNKGKAIRGQAFGVGVFEEDDEDIYTSYDLSQYDFEVGASVASTKESSQYDSTFVSSKKPLGHTRKFFEGLNPPAGFRPILKINSLKITNLNEKITKVKNKLTIFERAQFFGDQKNSVLELLNENDRKFINNVSQNTKEKNKKIESESLKIDSNLFEEEPMKNYRYKQYVHYLKRGLDYGQPPNLTRLEWEKELADFQNALPSELRALLPEVKARQKPLAQLDFIEPIAKQLKSRFQSENAIDDNFDTKLKDHDKIQAVRLKTFGDLTRIKYQWYPGKELCKRFNVPNPYPDSTIIGVPELQKSAKNKTNYDFSIFETNSGLFDTKKELEQKQFNENIDQNASKSNIIDEFLNWDDNKTFEKSDNVESVIKIEENNNAPFELLQALFEESSDSESSSADEETEPKNNDKNSPKLEILNDNNNLKETEKPLIVEKVVTVMDLVTDSDEYGPKLPSAEILNRNEIEEDEEKTYCNETKVKKHKAPKHKLSSEKNERKKAHKKHKSLKHKKKKTQEKVKKIISFKF